MNKWRSGFVPLKNVQDGLEAQFAEVLTATIREKMAGVSVGE